MAYDTQTLLEQAKVAIAEHRCLFIEDVVTFLPCSKPTFYEHFPKESNELNVIKELLEENRVVLKHSMRNRWYKSKAPALQIALMRLISSDEERMRLSVTHHRTEPEEPDLEIPLTKEQRAARIDYLTEKLLAQKKLREEQNDHLE